MWKKVILKVIQVAFIGVIGVFLLGSLARTVLFPKEINYYENRKANQFPEVSVRGFLNSDFQNGLDSALADQVFYSGTWKKFYNELESDISYNALHSIYDSNPGVYFQYNNIMVFNSEYLLFSVRELNDATKSAIDLKTESINSTAKKHKDIEFFAYYIEKDTDINFETNEKTGTYEYVKDGINEEYCKVARYEIRDFEDYSEKFYRTDHHWNNYGSYEGYLQVCKLLGITDPISKGEEYLVADKMTGSKFAYAKDTESWSEPMMAYRYDFPQMTVTLGKSPAADYGNQNREGSEFLNEDQLASYGAYYGGDSGQIILDTGNTDRENILLIGESYDNAILKLLATHYNKLYSVDLRNYEHSMGKTFDFDSYVKENDIDKVLFIGNIDFYEMTEFNVGGK